MTAQVEIALEWQPPLEELMRRHAEKMPAVIREVLARLGIEGESYAKRLTPVDTGRLRASITHEVRGGDTLAIGSNVEYAPFILADTPPYIIRVKRKKALAWVVYPGKGSKKTRPASNDAAAWRALRKRGLAAYAKWVRHPGGKDILGQTAKHLQDKMPAVVQQVLKAQGVI